MSDGVLSGIHLHPIKSCGRIEVTNAVVTAYGLQGDRTWQVIDADGAPLTQRQHPVLATIRPEPLDPTDPNSGLRISAPGRSTIEVAAPGDGPSVVARTLFGVGIEATHAGEVAATWFSEVLGVPAVLVGGAPDVWRPLPEKFDIWKRVVAFPDVGPVLVVNTASNLWLNERATEPFGIERFRPNLIVDTDEPWVEDTWQHFRIGAASLSQGLPWPRCAIPQVDQDTGVRGSEPARALRRFRWCESAPSIPEALQPIVQGNGLFGIGCSIGTEGTVISVGDEVQVRSAMAPVLAAPA